MYNTIILIVIQFIGNILTWGQFIVLLEHQQNTAQMKNKKLQRYSETIPILHTGFSSSFMC